MLSLRVQAQRGLSLVELMVGITIGMIVAAGATMVALNQVSEHRRLMSETQMQQDLRTAADLIQQDLRRAGFRGQSDAGVWAPDSGAGTAEQPATPNGYTTLTRTDNEAGRMLEYSYARPDSSGNYGNATVPASNEYFGVRWDRNTKTLYLKIGLDTDGKPNWQPITDPDATPIVDFDPQVLLQEMPLEDFCEQACPPGAACAAQPKLTLRQVNLSIKAQSATDRNVVRTLRISERIRADAQSGVCP